MLPADMGLACCIKVSKQLALKLTNMHPLVLCFLPRVKVLLPTQATSWPMTKVPAPFRPCVPEAAGLLRGYGRSKQEAMYSFYLSTQKFKPTISIPPSLSAYQSHILLSPFLLSQVPDCLIFVPYPNPTSSHSHPHGDALILALDLPMLHRC